MSEKESLLNKNGEIRMEGLLFDSPFVYRRVDLSGIRHTKEWDRYLVYNSSYAVEIIVSYVGYMLNICVTFMNFQKGTTRGKIIKKYVILEEVSLPEELNGGDIVIEKGSASLKIKRTPGYKTLEFYCKNFSGGEDMYLNICINEERKCECMSVFPMSDDLRYFLCCYNVNPAFANGILNLGKLSIDFENKNSFVLFSRGRGSFKYSSVKGKKKTVCSMSAWIDGIPFGFYVSDDKYDKVKDNIITYANDIYEQRGIHIHKNKKDDFKKWIIFSDDSKFGLQFIPYFKSDGRDKLGVHTIRKKIYFGFFSGEIFTDTKLLHIKDVFGVIEERNF